VPKTLGEIEQAIVRGFAAMEDRPDFAPGDPLAPGSILRLRDDVLEGEDYEGPACVLVATVTKNRATAFPLLFPDEAGMEATPWDDEVGWEDSPFSIAAGVGGFYVHRWCPLELSATVVARQYPIATLPLAGTEKLPLEAIPGPAASDDPVCGRIGAMWARISGRLAPACPEATASASPPSPGPGHEDPRQ